MKTPIISDLKDVTQLMIAALEVWLENKEYLCCPFPMRCGSKRLCSCLFINLGDNCPCGVYGEEATILAFTIICDVWPVYYGRK